jgi:prepilin-type N-terminal cleavage/methylation domain-containing protein
MKKIRGFTLIELLVVIAIIGILSSVVLVSLNSARSKGQAARVQEEVAQVRTQYEADYSNGAYAVLCPVSVTFCSLTTDVNGALSAGAWGASTNYATTAKDIFAQNGAGLKITMTSNSTATIGSPATGYAIYALLPGGTVYQCIDSSGNTKTNSTGPGTVAVGTAATCQ